MIFLFDYFPNSFALNEKIACYNWDGPWDGTLKMVNLQFSTADCKRAAGSGKRKWAGDFAHSSRSLRLARWFAKTPSILFE